MSKTYKNIYHELKKRQIVVFVSFYRFFYVKQTQVFMRKLLFLCMIISGCYKPTMIISGTTYPAITADQVKIYNEKNIPPDYQIIGTINVKSDASLGRNSATNRNLKKVKEKAAGVGANGLLIGNVSHKSNYWDDSMQMNVTAVYIKNIP